MVLGEQVNYSTITQEEEREHDKALLVTFEFRPKEYQENGERKFKDVEYVRIRPPGKAGMLSEVVKPVDDEVRHRFTTRYQAWKSGEEDPVEGTPLTTWPEILPSELAACKAERIKTIEQLAAAPDPSLQRAGLINLKYRARDWVQARKDNSYVNELRDQIKALKKEIEGLKEVKRLTSGNEDTTATGKPRKRRGRPRKTSQPDQ